MFLGFRLYAVCVYNQKTHSDSISFGAHPVAEIAMERAINEAFQGRSIQNITIVLIPEKEKNDIIDLVF